MNTIPTVGWTRPAQLNENGFLSVDVPVERIAGSEDLPLPHYASKGAAGFDIRVFSTTPVADVGKKGIDLAPGEVTVVNTGIKVAVPPGYELQIRMRGGTAKRGILLANSPGTIDADYRGELMLLLFNSTKIRIFLEHGERVCQGIVTPVLQARFIETPTLPPTERGEGRFNSTGTN